MLFELTLFATFTLYHLLIGGCLLLLLTILIKGFKPTAELQSWLWTTAFVLSTLLPFSVFVQDPQSQAVPLQQIEQRLNEASPAGETITTRPLDQRQPPAQSNTLGRLVYELGSGLYGFLFVWLIGSSWRAANVARSLGRTRRLVASARTTGDEFKHLGDFTVLISERAKTPMAVGLISPVVLLPKAMTDRFETKRLAPIVLHEWAHVQRRDLWVGLFQEILAIVFWWSPVMRSINRKIHISRELACDMRAAKQLSNGKQYARALVDCAELMLARQRNVMAMGLFGKKRDLSKRVNAVMKSETSRVPKVLPMVTVCLALAVTSIAVAQAYAPRVDLAAVRQASNHFSNLSRAQGEMLLEAIARNDTGMLELMIRNGLNLNTPIEGDGTALIVAVKHDNREMVEFLINLDADVNQSALGDGNPLIAAAATGNLELAELLYQQGADVDAIVPGDETPLINASRRSHLDMLKFLVERGADVNLGVQVRERGGRDYRSPLNSAKNARIRDYLISMGAQN